MESPSTTDFHAFATLALPWTPQEFPFLLALLRSVRRIPGEIAFALGGSFAANSDIPLSDLDFFLYVAQQDAYLQAKFLQVDLASHQSVITTCPLHYYHSFGYRCSWTLCHQPVSLVEVFVTSSLDLKATVMSKRNRLVIDKSPAYRSHLEVSRSHVDDSGDETLELILHDLLASAHKTRKEIESRSFVQAANRFYKFRMAVLSILVFAETGLVYHPLVGEKHIQSLKPVILNVLEESYRLSSIEDIALHFSYIVDVIKPGILALRESGQVSQHRATLIIEQLCGYALSC